MKRLTVPLALIALLFVAACDQSPTTSKPEAEKPGKTSETKPAEKPEDSAKAGTPGAADQASAKKPGPCAADRKAYCADKKDDEVSTCLKEHKTQLSAACRTLLKIE